VILSANEAISHVGPFVTGVFNHRKICLNFSGGGIVQVFLHSFLLVAASEMGDKTQLLALVLASRFRKPWTIMAGILVATILNHGLASWAGGWVSTLVSETLLRWILSGTFFAFALWILIPDKDEELKESNRFGPFLTTVVAFFLAEMGDKTQLATLALGARFASPFAVTLGTTAGMLLADGLAVFFGEKLTSKLSMKWVRLFASILFFIFGIGILLQ
jgi:putative Ca2+/H+ antiporter (TMEM165/GDT1 family)